MTQGRKIMKHSARTWAMKRIAFSALLVGVGAIFSSQLMAQQVYRIVGPDGKVTFSDQPPPPSANAKVSTGRGGSFGEAGSAALPSELRSVVQRFPVTLYTGKECVPCDSGRNLLRQRGVPFSERTIESNEDIEAFRRISGETTLPMATVGGQQMKGFSDVEWNQYLDAAGYPRQSALPAGYRNPAPAPMVARAAPAPAPAPAPAAEAAAAPTAAPAPANPAGIRF
jgi:glutaredoxin